MKWIALCFATVISGSAISETKLERALFGHSLAKKLFGAIPTKMNEVVPGQIMVKYSLEQAAKFEAEATANARTLQPRAIVGHYGERFIHRIQPSGWTLWSVPASTDTRALSASMMNDLPEVLYAEPVFKIYPLELPAPNDPDFNYLETDPNLSFDVNSDDGTDPFPRMWNLQDINALAGWSIYPGKYFTHLALPSYRPKICIIDTGCDTNHPDFKNVGATGTDITQGGQLNKTLSRFFTLGAVDLTGSIEDTNGHGTHVTGIQLAAANNGAFSASVDNGMPGVGYNGVGTVLRVFDDSGDGSDADAAAAIYYAATNANADIINLSLGETNYSQLFQDAVTYAFQKGSAVFAAGNENGNGGGNLGPIYPGACSGAYCVTAAGPGGSPATDYAGTGNYIQIGAPGGDVIGDTTGGTQIQIMYVWSTEMEVAGDLYNQGLTPPYNLNYGYLVGTSMACPHVSGAAATFYGQKNISKTSGYSNVACYRALSTSAQDIFGVPGGSWETNYGYGELDLNALLTGGNVRGATVGSIDGIVYYNTTAISNVAVTAKIGTQVFSTTTRADGTYRFDALPPGIAVMNAAPFGSIKTKDTVVKPGSDTPGVDFWCGTYKTDTTAPTLAIFGLTSGFVHSTTQFGLSLWAYDTESGIDMVTFAVGSTLGGSDIIHTTQFIPDTVSTVWPAKLKKGTTYFLAGTVVNGVGLKTTKTTKFVW